VRNFNFGLMKFLCVVACGMRKTKKVTYPLTRHQSVHILREEAQSNGIRSTTIGNYVDAIICGDAESTLRALPHESANAIVTSPPYYQQRDYGSGLQIGNESSPESYVQKLAGVFRESFRVLAKDGQALKKARGWNAIQTLGALYVIDTYRNVVVDQHVDLESMAKEYKVMQEFERLAA